MVGAAATITEGHLRVMFSETQHPSATRSQAGSYHWVFSWVWLSTCCSAKYSDSYSGLIDDHEFFGHQLQL